MSEKRAEYFEEALSDFVFEAAVGGAIRHLIDRGYSIEQIIKELDYPVPRERVEKAAHRYMTESGLLLGELPFKEEKVCIHTLQEKDAGKLHEKMMEGIEKYGVQNSYMECPFGLWKKNDEEAFNKALSCLSVREREYILGIRWEKRRMYHRLNERMREIAIKLVMHSDSEWRFYFIE